MQLGLSVTWVAVLGDFLRFYYFLEKQYLMIKTAKFQTITITRSKVIHVLIKQGKITYICSRALG